MKVLVTGHKGFIGSNLLKYLKERNYEVEGFDVKEISQSKMTKYGCIMMEMKSHTLSKKK